MIKVSVIVPIYNAEKYLERTIGSLLSQTIDNYEILLINDGSTDGSKSLNIMKKIMIKLLVLVKKMAGRVVLEIME